MAIGDKLGKAAIDELNAKTIPALDKIIDGVIADGGDALHSLLNRLDGAEIEVQAKFTVRLKNRVLADRQFSDVKLG